MRRRDLLQHLRQHGCHFVREGGEHSIWENPTTNRRTSIPRHREIPNTPQSESASNLIFLCHLEPLLDASLPSPKLRPPLLQKSLHCFLVVLSAPGLFLSHVGQLQVLPQAGLQAPVNQVFD
jgi:mRNA interferase HicA